MIDKVKSFVMMLFEIQFATIEIPFSISIDHSLKKRNCTQSFIIYITDANGLRGYGEGAPRKYVNNESIEQCKRAFDNIAWPQEISSLKEIKVFVEKLSNQRIPNALITAIELSLLDLYGKVKGECISEYLNSLQSFPLEYSIVLPFFSNHILENYLEKIKTLKPASLKFKVGREGDIEALQLIRKHLPDVPLRLDANCAWSLNKAISMIQTFSQFGISSIEEPLLQHERHLLTYLSREVDIPIMMDEAISTIEQAQYYTSHLSSNRFKVNLKISKMGGLFQTEKIHSFLTSKGVSCQLGCNVGETSILSSAGRLFAQSKKLIHTEGSLGSYFMESDITSDPLTFGNQGKAPAITKPGLGINVREDLLLRYIKYKKMKRIKTRHLIIQTS